MVYCGQIFLLYLTKPKKERTGDKSMKITKESLQNPPKKYRPLPFWSWNAKLETAETLEQVKRWTITASAAILCTRAAA